LRALLVSANFRPSVGGIERFVELLADGLATRGHDVTVLCCRTGRAPLREADGRSSVVRVPASDVVARRWNVPYPLPSPPALLRALRRLVSSADVVHVQDAIYATSVAALAWARARGVPTLLTQHVGFVPQSSRLLDGVERTALATLGRAARLASEVVTYNAAVADWARLTWGLADVRVLPVGVRAPDAGGADRATLRWELGLPEDRFLALFVGRDVPKKRLDVVLSARDPGYEIVAVTDRPAERVPAGIHILPFLEHERFQRLLLAADAFVLPSRAEGIPLALQEALVSGLPSVVTREPGYERAFRDGEVVYVEPTADDVRTAISRLAAEPALRSELSAGARAAGRREFGLERFVDAYEEAYAELLSSRPRASAILPA
jgi:glycosyltransferase involved in cell wall biosynthesis